MERKQVNHVYFNAVKSNSLEDGTVADSDLLFETLSDSYQSLIPGGSNWEVCVNRFKIPSASIPAIRLYEGEHLLGFQNGQTAGLKNHAFVIDGNTMRCTDHTDDTHMTDLFTMAGSRPGSSYDSVRGKYYYDIASQEKFAALLDAALMYCLSPRGDYGSQNNKYFITNDSTPATFLNNEAKTVNVVYVQNHPAAGATLVAYTLIAGRASPLMTFQAPNCAKRLSLPSTPVSIDPSTGRGLPSQKLTSIELTIKSLTLSVVSDDPNATPDTEWANYFLFKHLKLMLMVDRALPDGSVSTGFYTICEGILADLRVANFASTFPNGLTFSLFSLLEDLVDIDQSRFGTPIEKWSALGYSDRYADVALAFKDREAMISDLMNGYAQYMSFTVMATVDEFHTTATDGSAQSLQIIPSVCLSYQATNNGTFIFKP